MSLYEVKGLRVSFQTPAGLVRAVGGVSFSIERGETLALVGESGSGKSVTSQALLGLVPEPPGVVAVDSLRFDGRELARAGERAWRSLRGRAISMVFQDPTTALNPLMTVGRQIGEVLERHERLSPREARRRAAAGLGEVGIAAPEERLDAYPHELSGGLRQRVMIAIALACRPKLLVADEPTTALDVTIQAQILELLALLRRRHGMAVLLVTHSLGVVASVADRVLVMYAGKIVESAPTGALFEAPRHPYTAGLLASVPRIDGDVRASLASIEGRPPDLASPPAGCAFAPRCVHAFERCEREEPPLAPRGDRAHACFLDEPPRVALAARVREEFR